MTKRDYERAATITQEWALSAGEDSPDYCRAVEEAFVELFADDNPRFDEARFRAACIPGANVKARPRKVKA